ncbi:MAG: hypothetical protein A3E84_00670 [Gammaproteobacteria bacterium RIFCSPHIGHO2_12_FULL_42_13]|nr:MAG: hypothetical protein A3E84_00670 [Gammaproteobacteria bacterium RIFCSPHIGHO2_12_FULL_42_13]
MKDLDLYGWIALGLLIVGGIDLGLYGIFKVDLITAILGGLLGRLLFIVIGAAAGYFCYQIYLAKTKKVM